MASVSGFAMEELKSRDGIGHFMQKIREGKKEVAVAYLGGSITAMEGWRTLTTDWLRKTYPGVTFREIPASIGGTTSELGAFRVGHDVLAHKPDLVFVEFATNDRCLRENQVLSSMEGIVRQIWKQDPKIDIVFTYTIVEWMMGDYIAGKQPPPAAAMEKLADHYGIPSIDFGPRVTAEVKAGRLAMSPKSAKDGMVVFAKDGVHPAMSGHEFYLQSVAAAFKAMSDSKPVDPASRLKAPFVANNLENAKIAEITPDMLKGSWEKMPATDPLTKKFVSHLGEIWHSGKPGDALSFRFRGRQCMIYDIKGPDAGQLLITLDGKRRGEALPRFDSYCTYHRISTVDVFNGAEGLHEVKIEIDEKEPSRQSVAFRLKNPAEELAKPKFHGRNFWPAKILIDGEIVR